jgi:methyl-accepting chemotaxis protein
MLKKLKLAMKIGGGFGLVILLLIIISIVSWRGLSGVVDGFVEYRALARDTNLAGRLQSDMLMLRLNVKDFIITQSEKDVRQYREYYAQMSEALAEAHDEIQNPERAALIDEFSEDIVKYDEVFKEVVDLYRQRDMLVNEVLNKQGPVMEEKLSRIMRSAKEDDDAEAAYVSGQALRHLLLGRLYVVKFLDTNAVKDRERVENEFTELFSELDTLEKILENPERRKLNGEVSSLGRSYLESFDKVFSAITRRNELITGKLDKMGPEFAEDVEVVKLSVKKEQDTLGPLVQAKSANAVRVVLFSALLAILIAVAAAVFLTRMITGPIQKVVSFVDTLATGDFTSRLDIDQQDEIGSMSRSLGRTADELGGMIREIISGVSTLTESSARLADIASHLSDSAGEASGRANGVASAAEEMSANMNSVSAAMEQSSSNVGLVAAATEEMSATVNEIARNAERAKGISEEAVTQSKNTSLKITDLGQAASRIGKVTETITEISEQTNLLALNATIEAARAGDAGKGFAVVANEIKDLARQTAEATIDIKKQIDNIQKTTDWTIRDIEQIGAVIDDINEVITTIAAAVEQQSAATSEISQNVVQASAGITEVNENVAQSSVAIGDITKDIAEISENSEEINKSSGNVNDSAADLSRLGEQLENLVKRFKVT